MVKCRELFPGQPTERKCPECAKTGMSTVWEQWMGSLKEHLLEHYRTKYYLEKLKISETFKKPKNCPWAEEYEHVPREKLEKYLDRQIFENYFKLKQRKEEEAQIRKEREDRKMLLVEKERQQRRNDFEARLKDNQGVFSESDPESDSGSKKRAKRKRGFSSSDDSDGGTAKVRKPTSKTAKTESQERKRKSSVFSNPEKPKRVKLQKQELQKHNLEYKAFIDQLGILELRYCPMCDSEVPEGLDDAPEYSKQYENHVISCSV